MRTIKNILSGTLVSVFIFGGALLAEEHPAKVSPMFTQEASPAASAEEEVPAGENFKGFRFGANLNEFKTIRRANPSPVLIAEDEVSCAHYGPGTGIEIGDFRVPPGDIYLVFYKDRLVRIRILNSFRSGNDQDHRFFTAMRGALSEKYGKAESEEPELTRYDGRYTWKTATLRVVLTYPMLEYTWLDLEREMYQEFKIPSRIKSTDL